MLHCTVGCRNLSSPYVLRHSGCERQMSSGRYSKAICNNVYIPIRAHHCCPAHKWDGLDVRAGLLNCKNASSSIARHYVKGTFGNVAVG